MSLPEAAHTSRPWRLHELTPDSEVEDEWAAEMANRTVHTVLHLSWVPDGSGGHRGQTAVPVEPDGLFGPAYMDAITPFRHLLVLPAPTRSIERGWASHAGRPSSTRT